MSDVTTCRTCGLPRFHGPAGYAGAQCLCQWKGATLPQMYDELMAKNAALEAENARLLAANLDCVAHFEQMRAQLAAIQGGMGEVVGFDRNAAYAACPESGCDWGSFYVGWKAAAAQHQRITAAMAAEVADAKSARDAYGQNAIDLQKQRDALRAELAEVNGREAVGEVQLRTGGGISLLHVDLTQPLPPGTKLYALPPASPDVEGLVKALTKTVASLDQLLPYLGKIPTDVGLLNDALVAARPLLEQNTNKEVTPDGK